jgi:hypothetical protein
MGLARKTPVGEHGQGGIECKAHPGLLAVY